MGKIPWRRKWLPTPVSLPGESQDRGAWWVTVHGFQRVGHDWVTNTATINSTTLFIYLKSYIYLFVSLALKPVKTGTVLYFFLRILLIYLAVLGLSCGTWDVWSSLQQPGSLVSACELLAVAPRSSSLTRDRTQAPELGATSLRHWTTREIPAGIASWYQGELSWFPPFSLAGNQQGRKILALARHPNRMVHSQGLPLKPALSVIHYFLLYSGFPCSVATLTSIR